MKVERELFTESIALTWQQRLSAYWCIAWPAWVGSFLLIGIGTSPIDADALIDNSYLFSLAAQALFLSLQFPLVHRLVRKNFRTFWVAVVRDGSNEQGRTLRWGEAWHVFQCLVLPQALFRLLVLIGGVFFLHDAAEDLIRGFDMAARMVSVLAVGPYAVFRAMERTYPAFRLESCGATATMKFFGA